MTVRRGLSSGRDRVGIRVISGETTASPHADISESGLLAAADAAPPSPGPGRGARPVSLDRATVVVWADVEIHPDAPANATKVDLLSEPTTRPVRRRCDRHVSAGYGEPPPEPRATPRSSHDEQVRPCFVSSRRRWRHRMHRATIARSHDRFELSIATTSRSGAPRRAAGDHQLAARPAPSADAVVTATHRCRLSTKAMWSFSRADLATRVLGVLRSPRGSSPPHVTLFDAGPCSTNGAPSRSTMGPRLPSQRPQRTASTDLIWTSSVPARSRRPPERTAPELPHLPWCA